jgi:6-phosphofructokinase 2
MEKIITITLNPALDKTIMVDELVPDKKLRSTYSKVEPGGGGINVSRAIKQLGGETEAVYLCGGYTGKRFEELLKEEQVISTALAIKGETRENFVVVEDSSDKQYRFGMEGPAVTEEEWQQVLTHVSKAENIAYIIASGSLPPGAPPDFFGKLAVVARQKNAKLIVDTSGEALEHAVKEGLYLIKPNLDELSALSGKETLNQSEIVSAALGIIRSGGCEVMVVSMGKDGAILITADKELHVRPPKVEVHSTVGAGDSMVGGMVLALSQNRSLEDMLYYGIAAGTAATMNEGTELCKKDDTEQIFARMKQQ